MSENRDQAEFYRRQDEERTIASLCSKVEMGIRLSHYELTRLLAEDCVRIETNIKRAMREARAKPGRDHSVRFTQGSYDAIHMAVSHLISEMAINRVKQIEARERLEDRVIELEQRLARLEGTKQEVFPPVRLVR